MGRRESLKLRDARSLLTKALYQLDRGDLVSAWLSAAVAIIRIADVIPEQLIELGEYMKPTPTERSQETPRK